MKNLSKYLLLGAFCVASTMVGQSTKESIKAEFVNFVKSVQEKTDAWLKFSKAFHNAKNDLIIKHHYEMFNQKIADLKGLNAQENAEAYLARALNNWKKLYEKQTQEWRDLWREYVKKGAEIYKKEHKSSGQVEEDGLYAYEYEKEMN